MAERIEQAPPQEEQDNQLPLFREIGSAAVETTVYIYESDIHFPVAPYPIGPSKGA